MGADELQTIPARHGVATFVPKGQTIKIVNTSGTQVIDTWAFALPAPPKQSTAAEQKQAEEAVAQAKEDIAAAVQAQDEDKKEEQVSGEAQIQEQKSDDQTQSGAQEEEEKTETGKSEAQAQDEGNPDLGDQTDGQGESKSSVPGASSIPGASTVGVAASSVTNAASSVGSAASNAVGMGATKDEGAPDPPEEVPSTDKPSAQKAGGKKAGVFSDEDAASMAALSGSQPLEGAVEGAVDKAQQPAGEVTATANKAATEANKQALGWKAYLAPIIGARAAKAPDPKAATKNVDAAKKSVEAATKDLKAPTPDDVKAVATDPSKTAEDTKKTAENAEKGADDVKKQVEKTASEATSKGWSAYLPSGFGFTSYLPSTKGALSAFASSHHRDPNKSYAEQLYEFSKTPVGAASLSVATGSGAAGTLYAAYSAYMTQQDQDVPPMEFLSMPHTRTKLCRLIPRVNDTLVSNLREPLLTIIEDTSPGIHDTLMAACDPARYKDLGVEKWEEHGSCAENLVLALKELNDQSGLEGPKSVGADVTVNMVPAPFNLFMNVPFDEEGELSFEAPKSGKGDFIRMKAERDLVIVMSACPQDVTDVNGKQPMDGHYIVEEFKTTKQGTQGKKAPTKLQRPSVSQQQQQSGRKSSSQIQKAEETAARPSMPSPRPSTTDARPEMPRRGTPKKIERKPSAAPSTGSPAPSEAPTKELPTTGESKASDVPSAPTKPAASAPNPKKPSEAATPAAKPATQAAAPTKPAANKAASSAPTPAAQKTTSSAKAAAKPAATTQQSTSTPEKAAPPAGQATPTQTTKEAPAAKKVPKKLVRKTPAQGTAQAATQGAAQETQQKSG